MDGQLMCKYTQNLYMYKKFTHASLGKYIIAGLIRLQKFSLFMIDKLDNN